MATAQPIPKVKVPKERNVEEMQCVVCLEREKNTLFLPCKHVNSCNVCATKLTNCPICRELITRKISNIYLNKYLKYKNKYNNLKSY